MAKTPQVPPTKPVSADPTIKFNLKIASSSIKTYYQTALKNQAKTITLKGFRPGKAPLNLVEASLDKAKLYETVLQLAFPPAYQQEIKKRQLKPVIQPKVEILSAKDEGDWEFKVSIAERPQVSLGDYETSIKKITKDPKDTQKTLNQIFDLLLKTTSVSISSLLVEDETNRSLSKLLEQIEKLGLTLDQYVASLNKTLDQIKAEYRQNAEATLKLEYILEEIGHQKKLQATDKEFTDFLSQVTDPKTKSMLNKPGISQDTVRYTLTKKKVLDYLQDCIL